MSLISKLQKYQKNIYIKKNKSLFKSNYENQSDKLNSFNEPKNLIERSLFQYQCQMSRISVFMRITQNLIAVFMLLYYLLKPYKRNFKVDGVNRQNIAVFLREGITIDTIPKSVDNEYEIIHECPLKGEMYLDNNDKKIILNSILKYWYLPFFCLKCVVKVAIYSRVIHEYKPTAILTHCEYSFASSFLTMYCGLIGVEHINVMHGEKLFNIRDSFVCFNRYFVWDQHYIDLLVKLRAAENQFKIEIPSALNIDIDGNKDYTYTITYYLGGESKSELLKIKDNLLNIGIALDKICIRYHPRYSDVNQVKNIFRLFVIENPQEITLDNSLSITEYVASLYSTVLYQAYTNRKDIIIDDISDPQKYEKLKSLDYIMMSKTHLKLSEFIRTEQS